jgi:hypothetical protein
LTKADDINHENQDDYVTNYYQNKAAMTSIQHSQTCFSTITIITVDSWVLTANAFWPARWRLSLWWRRIDIGCVGMVLVAVLVAECYVAGLALDMHKVCTGIDPDMDTEEILDIFIQDAFDTYSGVVVSCLGNVEGKVGGVIDTIDEQLSDPWLGGF